MKKLLVRLQSDFPQVGFKESTQFRWSPSDKIVFYDPDKNNSQSRMALLHELSHALLGHAEYKTDFDLLQLEVAAWHNAEKLAKKYAVEIDEDHIQDCLDTYRNWLHARSACPACTEHGLQKNRTTYSCLNCHAEWHVSGERFCRPYRMLSKAK